MTGDQALRDMAQNLGKVYVYQEYEWKYGEEGVLLSRLLPDTPVAQGTGRGGEWDPFMDETTRFYWGSDELYAVDVLSDGWRPLLED